MPNEHPTVQDQISLTTDPSRFFEPDRKRFQESDLFHLPLVTLDAEGTIEHLTPAARRVLEYRLDQPMQPCFFSHVHSKNLHQIMRDLADMVCRGKGHASWLVRLRTGQNRWRWYVASAKNELSQSQKAIVVHLRDVHGA